MQTARGVGKSHQFESRDRRWAFDDTRDALEFWAHVLAYAAELDRVLEAHLAVRVHEALFDELLPFYWSRIFELFLVSIGHDIALFLLTY